MNNDESLRFGTVGAPQTTPGSGTEAAIAHTAALGLHHLEIAWTRSVRVSDATCAAIKSAAAEHGITLSVHAPYFINLNSQTSEKMAASDARLLAAARQGYKAGATDIVFHPGSYHGQPAEQVCDRMREKLIELTSLLREEGTHVTLRPETMGRIGVYGDLEEVLALCQGIDGVQPCVDWAHLYARTLGSGYNEYDDFCAALEAIRAVLGDAALGSLHNHVSGIAYTDKGEREHIPLNESTFNYRALLAAFIECGVRGTVGVEAPQPFHTADCLTIQATFRRLHEQHNGVGLKRTEET